MKSIAKDKVSHLELSFPVQFIVDLYSLTQCNINSLTWKGTKHPTDTDSDITEITAKIHREERIFTIILKDANIRLTDDRLTSKCENLEKVINPSDICKSTNEIENTAGVPETNGVPKRKRGRPKGSTKSVSKAKEDGDGDTERETKRYGLRGVKISETVMKAEMGSAYKEIVLKNAEKKKEIHLDHAEETQIEEEKILHHSEEESKEINEDDDVRDKDFVAEDYIYSYASDIEEEFEPQKTKKKMNSVTNKRKRIQLDIGDVVVSKNKKEKIKYFRNKKCKYCPKLFYHVEGVEGHVRRHHMKETDAESYVEELKNRRIVKCELCDKTFNNRYLLIEHEKRAHVENTSIKCHKCGKMYKNLASLKNHITAVHGRQREHSCQFCDAKFKTAGGLKQHIDEIHVGKVTAECKFCGKKFSRQHLLNRHIRIHGVDQSKRLSCTICGRGFWHEQNLRRHEKLIHGPTEENFHCSYCGKGFNLKSSMVTHVQQIHFHIYPFKCNICNVGYKHFKMYNVHMYKEHGISNAAASARVNRPRFKYGKTESDLLYCSHCSLSFCYKSKMVEHMHSAHSEDFPYLCTHCNQGFLEKAFLSTHMLKAHNEVLPSEETEEETKNRFQMVTIDINGQKKDLEVESFNLPQPVMIEKTEEVSDAVNIEMRDTEVEAVTDTQSVFFEVSKGSDTIRYVIEPSANGDPTILPQELANLLLAAEQSLQEQETSQVQLVPQETSQIQLVPQEQDTFISTVEDVEIISVPYVQE